MSTRYYAYISVRETDYARPEVRALFDEQFPNQYVKPKIEDGVVTFEDHRDNYVHFVKLETALERLGIAFDRKSSACDEFAEVLVQNRPDNDWVVYPMLKGEYVIPAWYIRVMKSRLTPEEFWTWADSLPKPVSLLGD